MCWAHHAKHMKKSNEIISRIFRECDFQVILFISLFLFFKYSTKLFSIYITFMFLRVTFSGIFISLIHISSIRILFSTIVGRALKTLETSKNCLTPTIYEQFWNFFFPLLLCVCELTFRFWWLTKKNVIQCSFLPTNEQKKIGEEVEWRNVKKWKKT